LDGLLFSAQRQQLSFYGINDRGCPGKMIFEYMTFPTASLYERQRIVCSRIHTIAQAVCLCSDFVVSENPPESIAP
jgi:hypothetical protein